MFAALGLAPISQREDAQMIMLAMVGVTALDGDPLVTVRHALRIATLMGANSARARVELQACLDVTLSRSIARESREQSFAYFLDEGKIRQRKITHAPLTSEALRVLRRNDCFGSGADIRPCTSRPKAIASFQPSLRHAEGDTSHEVQAQGVNGLRACLYTSIAAFENRYAFQRAGRDLVRRHSSRHPATTRPLLLG